MACRILSSHSTISASSRLVPMLVALSGMPTALVCLQPYLLPMQVHTNHAFVPTQELHHFPQAAAPMSARMLAQVTRRASVPLATGLPASVMARPLKTPHRQQERIQLQKRMLQAPQVAIMVAATVETAETGKSEDMIVLDDTGTNVPRRKTRLSNHWQWVIMLVILVVGIAGIWIGACIWRRRYLRKKDRQTSLGQKHSGSASHPSWGPAVTGTETATPTAHNAGRDPERGVATEKAGNTQPKKKWTVTQRT